MSKLKYTAEQVDAIQIRLESELMVDHLTGVIAPTMPAWTGSTERR